MPVASSSASIGECVCCVTTPDTIEIDIFGGAGCYAKFAGQYKLQFLSSGAHTCEWRFNGDFGGHHDANGPVEISYVVDCGGLSDTVTLSIEDLVEGTFILYNSGNLPDIGDCCSDYTMGSANSFSCGMDPNPGPNVLPKVYVFPDCGGGGPTTPVGGMTTLGVGGGKS